MRGFFFEHGDTGNTKIFSQSGKRKEMNAAIPLSLLCSARKKLCSIQHRRCRHRGWCPTSHKHGGIAGGAGRKNYRLTAFPAKNAANKFGCIK
jgi:hypothetical protein